MLIQWAYSVIIHCYYSFGVKKWEGIRTLQDSGDLATDFSVAKLKKSVSKFFSDGFATEKNSVGKTLLTKLSDENLQSVAKFSDGF